MTFFLKMNYATFLLCKITAFFLWNSFSQLKKVLFFSHHWNYKKSFFFLFFFSFSFFFSLPGLGPSSREGPLRSWSERKKSSLRVGRTRNSEGSPARTPKSPTFFCSPSKDLRYRSINRIFLGSFSSKTPPLSLGREEVACWGAVNCK